jgi:hypothetical protein
METTSIWISNLKTALMLAIVSLENSDDCNTILCEGYREVLRDLNDGKMLRIKDYDC